MKVRCDMGSWKVSIENFDEAVKYVSSAKPMDDLPNCLWGELEEISTFFKETYGGMEEWSDKTNQLFTNEIKESVDYWVENLTEI